MFDNERAMQLSCRYRFIPTASWQICLASV
jgi:hypothetical protein